VAREVWELRFADVTLSPLYTAAMGLVSEERGLSMRFPRFIRVREDKGIDEVSTGRELAAMWEKQNETAVQDIPEESEGEE
jgi:DNA ligase 1